MILLGVEIYNVIFHNPIEDESDKPNVGKCKKVTGQASNNIIFNNLLCKVSNIKLVFLTMPRHISRVT